VHRSSWKTCSLVAVVACFGLITASCGSDGDGGGASATTAATATTASATTAGAATTESAPSTTGAGTSATTAGKPTGDPYKIAIVSDLTGVAVSTGGPGANGFQAAFGAINDAGGVNGHPIEFSTFDTLSTADGGVQALQAALAKKPDVIASGNNSTILAAQQTVLGSANVPLVGNVSIDALLYPNSTPWYFTMSTTSKQLGTYVAGGAMTQLGGSLNGKRVAIQGIQAASVEPTIAAAEDFIAKNGGQVVAKERTPFQLVDFTAQAANIAAAKPDVVISFDNAPNSKIIVKALTNAGVTVPIMGGDSASDTAVLTSLATPNFITSRSGQEPVKGDQMSMAAAAHDVDAVGAYFTRGWAGAYMIADTLKRCGFPCAYKDFVAAAEAVGQLAVPANALFGPATWSPDRHYGITKVQFFHYDKDKGAVVPLGDPLNV
jgi:ABC-type branched-subunit amino acid transport system substrate-binding protein